MANKTELIEKLQKHEKSAREIGNIGEADNFKKKINELLAKYKKETSASISALVKCSCGYELDVTIQAGSATQMIFDGLIQPHHQAGHKITIYQKQ